MKWIALLTLTLVLCGCSTYPPTQVVGAPEYSEREYKKLFEANTIKKKQYQGLQNTMVVKATQLTPKLSEAILARKARIFQWDQSKYESERDEMRAQLSRGASFFVSLYTPGGRLDDLTRKKNLWSLLLDTGSQRYKGAVEKVNGDIEELLPIYPVHDRFSRAYLISFPVATENLADKTEFIITGPVDSATLTFQE